MKGKKTVKFRTPYVDFDKPVIAFEGEKSLSMTKQAFAEECDINNILKKYNKTGILPHLAKADPRYGDFSTVPDYQDALNTVLHAQTQFAALPAHARDRFANDPSRFLAFAQDPTNNAELVAMGLASERPAKGPAGPQDASSAKPMGGTSTHGGSASSKPTGGGEATGG